MGPPPLPFTDRQSITRAELTAPLRALQKKCPGIPLHLVTDSELGECGKRLTNAPHGNKHVNQRTSVLKAYHHVLSLFKK